MESGQERATKLFREGYNCAQAVFAAYAEELGLEPEMALKLSASFGGGMGRMREVCGACSAMFMIAGLKTGATTGSDAEGKKANYDLVQHLASEFRKMHGTILCRELLGVEEEKERPTTPEARTEEYYSSRPCLRIIADTAELIERELLN